jgi:hypothetical protein
MVKATHIKKQIRERVKMKCPAEAKKFTCKEIGIQYFLVHMDIGCLQIPQREQEGGNEDRPPSATFKIP